MCIRDRAERSALAARVDALERRAADLEATGTAHHAAVAAKQEELLAEFARRLAASNARAAELELRAAGTRPDDDKSDGEETDEDEKRTRREGKPDVARGLLEAAGSGATVVKSEDLMQTLTQQELKRDGASFDQALALDSLPRRVSSCGLCCHLRAGHAARHQAMSM